MYIGSRILDNPLCERWRKSHLKLIFIEYLRSSKVRLPLDGFWLKFVFDVFFENLWRNLEYHCSTTGLTGTLHAHLWSYLAELLLKWEIFQIEFVEKIKTHFYQITFSLKCAVYETVWEKNDGARRATHDNIVRHMRFACWITKATHAHTHTRARAPSIQYLLLFHSHNCLSKARQCYVIHTVPVLHSVMWHNAVRL